MRDLLDGSAIVAGCVGGFSPFAFIRGFPAAKESQLTAITCWSVLRFRYSSDERRRCNEFKYTSKGEFLDKWR